MFGRNLQGRSRRYRGCKLMELLGFNLIVAHLVGDYILQNDYMAKNKKASSAVLPFML